MAELIFQKRHQPGEHAHRIRQRRAVLQDNRSMQAGKLADGRTAQLAQKSNNTGLPNNLKSGIESLSGMSMDNVRVHYNSSKPAQLNAHAYAQGTDIHVAPGQEQHLPHEAWHVVQQAQGRVQPTMQMKGGVSVNDNAGLEREADVMGARASVVSSGIATSATSQRAIANPSSIVKQLRNHTEITYQQGELRWRAAVGGVAAVRHQPVGINTTAFIDPEDPEQGERTGAAPAPSIYSTPPAGNYAAQNGGANLTQGHLLNANLGGKAQSYNLFPITTEMNRAHSNLVEDNVKNLVLNVMQNRRAEGSQIGGAGPGGGVVAAAGLATSRGRAANQVAVSAANTVAQTAAGAASAAIGPAIAAALGMPAPFGLTLAGAAASVAPGANPGTVASAVINAAPGAGAVTAAQVVQVANAVAVAVPGVAGAIAGVVGVAGGAPNPGAAAAAITAAIGAAPTAAGIAGAHTATPDDIATAVSTAPAGGLPAVGGGGPQWDNVRVFYNVRVTAPGINGAAPMRPNTLRNEQFHCTAYPTTNNGVTRDMAGPYFNTLVRAPHSLNTDLAALGFGPTMAPVPGLAISAATVAGGGPGGAGALNAPSQHNVINGAGAVVGHATLFKHH